jgi:hypothetical protein
LNLRQMMPTSAHGRFLDLYTIHTFFPPFGLQNGLQTIDFPQLLR